MPAATIDVVVPTYNGWDMTESWLRHLAAQAIPHHVIIGDNASSDGTRKHVRASWGEVDVVETGGNLGFAVACNAGVAAGSSEIVVLLNNDVDADPTFLQRLIEPLADERVGTVAALLVRPDRERIDSIGLAADPTLAGFPGLQGRPVSEAADPSPELLGPSGGAAAYRREAWEALGGLNEHIFIYQEDLDLALRLRSGGWTAASAPASLGIHLGSATIVRRSSWQRRQGGFARGYLSRRYRLLWSSAGPRKLVTGAMGGWDALISRDLAALRGRLHGWKTGSGLPRHAVPLVGIDRAIGLRESFRLRRLDYAAVPDGG
jgi:N-acetylglucosaminyl-diphospho-decaprenol L-rhamnosyltransferase